VTERRKEERYIMPEIYRKYITFKVRKASGDFVDVELFNFSTKGISIKSEYGLPINSAIECLIAVPKSLTREIPFTGKIKYCIQDEPGGDYLIGAEIIRTDDKIWFEIFSKVHDFIKERIGGIY
jgi:hypothetical protein